MDRLSSDVRSKLMGRIRSKDTAPELAVRRILFAAGYRYRLHDARLPGRPDLVFSRRRKAVFVHGCFWHQHENCRDAYLPATRVEYWLPKLQRNIDRDRENRSEIAALGWTSIVVWECETGDEAALRCRLARFLGPPRLTD